MALSNNFKSNPVSDTINGALIGFLVGVALTLESWVFAGVIKVLLTWDTGIWPDGFPGHIFDFILSRLWAVTIIVICMLGGAIAGRIWRRRLNLF